MYNSQMPLRYENSLIPFAKQLRRNMTPQEKHLWYEVLSGFSPRFQRQKVIGRFVADFYCHKARLVVEIDGGQHYTEEGLTHDADRSETLNRLGLRIIRFSNRDIDENIEGVYDEITEAVRVATLNAASSAFMPSK
jgi:very-short-patch-repair endonuclease